MSRFIEAIKCKNGQLYNTEYHTARFNLTMKENYSNNSHVDLDKLIKIPAKCNEGLFKCRIIYSDQIHNIEFLPYQPQKINSLKLVEDNGIEYSYKFADRKRLNELFEKRGSADDILIVKNGCITDSYFANSVFSDGQKWWTPDTPLLPGTKRASLIDAKRIFVTRIALHDLKKFKYVGLINAMLDLDNMPKIPISEIR
jgi:4-amino-4-deoxychorismate lyase